MYYRFHNTYNLNLSCWLLAYLVKRENSDDFCGCGFCGNPSWYLVVPRIIKSRSQCPILAVFVENVEVLPGTDSSREGRNILVLSQRCDHLVDLAQELEMINQECFVLHGKMGVKKRRQVMMEFDEKEEPKVLLSTGSLIGEGFDKPVLDTLFLALPIS